MKNSCLIFLILISASLGFAKDEAAERYAALEHRLQSLKSLEIDYEAVQIGGADIATGKMIWMKPDRFYHDTPEWTLCETGGEQWRLLKADQTLIRETAAQGDQWLGEQVLFNFRKRFRAVSLIAMEGSRVALTLESTDPAAPGSARVEFADVSSVPDAIQFETLEGSQVRYRILTWTENVKPDAALFEPPPVPADKMIDFRGAGK